MEGSAFFGVLVAVGTLVAMIVVSIKVMIDNSKKQKKNQLQCESITTPSGNTIVSTAIINTTTVGKTKASVKSSIVRGAVGGAVFGPIGAVAGAVTPKKKTVMKDDTVTFAILYANGKRKVETVKVGSMRYYQLAKYLA